MSYTSSGLFTVELENMEIKEYDLSTTRFRILGQDRNSIGFLQEDDSRRQGENKMNLEPRNSSHPLSISRPGVITTVNFSLFIEPHFLQVGEKIVINGNIPQMSGWTNGIELTPSEDLSLWVVTLNLPFLPSDVNPFGIFKFRYEIMGPNGNIPEQVERSEQNLRLNYFHVFRGNFKFARFRGWTPPPPREIFQYYCRRLHSEFVTGRSIFETSFVKFGNLLSSFPESHRSHVESLFEEILDQKVCDIRISSFTTAGISPTPRMCIVSGICAFGLTSEEKVYTSGNGSFTSYSYMGGNQISNPVYSPYGTVTKRKPPRPTKWVYFCANEVNVTELYALKWSEVFGTHFRWVYRGIVEAIERLSEHGSYDWLRIYPIASKFSLQPRITHKTDSETATNKDQVEVEDLYLSMTRKISTLVMDQIELTRLQSEYSKQNREEVIGLENILLQENEPIEMTLSREWIRAIVLYSPTLTILSKILMNRYLGIVQVVQNSLNLQSDLIKAFQSKIQIAEMKESDLVILEEVVTNIRFLLCPEVALALLKNTSLDDATHSVITLISICLDGHVWRHEDKPGDEINTSLVGLQGIWHELNAAAKALLCRKHGMEPIPEMVVQADEKRDSFLGWNFVGWGTHYPERRPKRLTEAEQRDQYRDKMKLALRDVQDLLLVPFFTANPNGIIFELGRCWFMKPSNIQQTLSIFNSLCDIGSQGLGFGKFHEDLANYLESKIKQQLREIALVPNSHRMIFQCLDRYLSNQSPLGHLLLHQLVLLLTWSSVENSSQEIPFETILQNSEFWQCLHSWLGSVSAQAPVFLLMQNAAETLSRVAKQLEEFNCKLDDMHTVMNFTDAFFLLLNEFDVNTSMKSVGNIETAMEFVRKFDTSLEQFQTYVSFFCSCGVKIESTALRKKAELLREGYNSITLLELPNIFNDIPVMTFIPWLYQLRSSELFLQEWRKIGRQICVNTILGAGEILDSQSIDTSLEGISPEITRNPDEDDQTFAERIAGLETLLSNRTRETFEEQDRRNSVLSLLDHFELSQDTVVSSLIPAMKERWLELAVDTFTGKLTIAALDQTFSLFSSEDQIKDELEILLKTSGWIHAMGSNAVTYLEKALRNIKDYHFFKKLQIWLPALLVLHEELRSLFMTPPEDDSFRASLLQTSENMKANFSTLTLDAIPSLVFPIRGTFSKYSLEELDFLSLLSTSPKLTAWLLLQESTEEFNRLLQVVRPCTDEPRMLSAIASLVHIRTILIQVLYVPQYDTFVSFLDLFHSNVELSIPGELVNALWHLNNIISSFDSLMEVFQKQTRSPGIKACYDLHDLKDRGIFVLRPSSVSSEVLTVEFSDPADSNSFVKESIDYLLDLRSKLLMTEIPQELEREIQASIMVESFVQQLQILSEISDLLVDLYVTGHLTYQNDFEMRIKFSVEGLDYLNTELLALRDESVNWEREVKFARASYYYLNFFTMQELLRLRSLLNDSTKPAITEVENNEESIAAVVCSDLPENEVDAEQMEQMGFSKEWARSALRRCNGNIESAIDFCLSNSQFMERYIIEDQQFKKAATPRSTLAKLNEINNIEEINGLLHLVSSTIDISATYQMIEMWKSQSSTSKSMLNTFGVIFTSLFGQNSEINYSRGISRLSDGATNRVDLLFLPDEEFEKRFPLFVTCAESPLLVIDTVLSIYFRRGRLPEPGEIIFCTNETTLEDLSLILLRFITAKTNLHKSSIFCIADIHNLSYSLQCSFVEKVRTLISECGTQNATTLVLVSGVPRQVLLNALSSHAIELPPLDLAQLRKSCAEAFRLHLGHTECIASTINGGGKSHYILGEIANRQLCGDPLYYTKIPLRESTNSLELVSVLSSASVYKDIKSSNPIQAKIAFHIDIAHIIPPSANTMLFQLLLIGVLRCPKSCRVYYRNPADLYFVEVPNSPKNKTILALRFCNLLPHILLEVNDATLQFTRPVVQNYETSSYPFPGTRIAIEEYLELSYVCKWLRAIKSGRICYGGPMYDPAFSPWTDEYISANECFELLLSVCSKEGKQTPQPSWNLFHSIVIFLNMQFSSVEKYPLLQSEVLTFIQGLENFKHVFVGLLVETSIDFSLRSVPQVEIVGPLAGGETICAEISDFTIELDDFPPAPVLKLQTSSEMRQASQVASTLNPPSIIHQTSEEVVRRFQSMVSWEDTDHPIVLFKMDSYGEVLGVDILSLNIDFVDKYFNGELKRSLEENNIDFNRDWTNLSNDEGVQILRQVEGLNSTNRGGITALEPGYVMTVDNLLKMLSIQLRLRFHLPVVIMGETGCGKSTLIRNMCAILGTPLHILNIHGGMEEPEIISWMTDKIRAANRMNDPTERMVIFLDEINTCNCMGLFKEIVCDRSLNGKILPSNIKIIAACNPYRLRSSKSLYHGEEMAGLVFENFSKNSVLENVGTGIKDPLRNLVYRVHPLPESMIDHIFDFGALSTETESLYIKAMLRKRLELFRSASGQSDQSYQSSLLFPSLSPFEEFIEVFSELICESQECIRQLSDGERSVASLRDVSRCVQVFIWFGEYLASTTGTQEGWNLNDFFNIKPKVHKYLRKVVILSLSYCYHARLPRNERRILINSITNKWRSFQVTPASHYQLPLNNLALSLKPRCRWLNLDFSSFVSILEETQREFVSVMNLGDGIALNEALCENLFMILCSVLNQIPIFVIGKPGTSKSLAMGLIQSNLNGEASDNHFLRSLPAVEVFSYQCSPLSTSYGIEQVFDSARRYKREATNTIVVILLDEVGLAEQSPHLPLKVLHKMLDEAGGREAVVGISNWSLDPAKMNRAVHLYRPAPTVEDLSITAEGMVRSANLKGYLHELARAYNEIYQGQEHPDFWGLREFYSTVRAINSQLSLRKSIGQEIALNSEMLMSSLLRNFGGRPQEMEKIMNCFFHRLGLPPITSWKEIKIEDLIRRNLVEPDARHLMLLTKNNAALSLLLDRNILQQERTEIIYGSDFPLDQNDLQICINIQRIKLCMAEGVTVVLVHCESLYESLYDLLNQHYVEYGGQIYVRLAFGTYTRLCPLHRNFRIVVIVEKEDAYTRLAPPLLNRFEKQVFERSNVLSPDQKHTLGRLQQFVNRYASVGNVSLSSLRSAFCGYHSDILSSLILATELSGIEAKDPDILEDNDDRILRECIRRLLWISTPEAVCRLLRGGRASDLLRDFGIDCPMEYFKSQCHSSLDLFTGQMTQRWSDRLGSQVMLMTYSPMTQDAASILRDKGFFVNHIVLHELDQERELRQLVSDFFTHAHSGSTLLLQCDPVATSRRLIEHSKFLVELLRAKKLKQLANISTYEGEERKVEGAIPEYGNIHVIFLVHLSRGENKFDACFNIDFDTRWNIAFLDSVNSSDTSGLPDVEAIIGKSLLEIFSSLDPKKVLLKSFRASLSKLICLFDRSNEDVRRQVVNVNKCLHDSNFLDLIQVSLRKLIIEKCKNQDVDITTAALVERELQLAGSFRAALHRQILDAISTLFALILSHVDRNNNLSLYLESPFSALWVYLFTQSFNELTLLSKIRLRRSLGQYSHIQNQEVVEFRSDSSTPFSNRFPFSYFLISLIDTLRKSSEDKGEVFLQKQFSSMCLERGISESTDRRSILAYVHDFSLIKIRSTTLLSGDLLAEIVYHLLCLAADDAKIENSVTLLTEVHFRFWVFERVFELYFDILESQVVPTDIFVRFICDLNSPLNSTTHFGFLQLIIEHLDPKHIPFERDGLSSFKSWFSRLSSIRSTFMALIDLLEEDSSKFLAQINWKKYEFIQTFLKDISIPFEVPTNLVTLFLNHFSDPHLATSSALQSIFSILGQFNYETTPYEFLCPITLEKMTHPVIAADGFTYERSAIECWFKSGKNTSPSTNEPLRSQTLEPNEELIHRLELSSGSILMRFLEYYVFDIIFSPLYRSELSSSVILDLLSYISGEHFIFSVPSRKFIEGVLREIFKCPGMFDMDMISSCLEIQLKRTAIESGFLDTPLSIAYVTIQEELCDKLSFPSSELEVEVSKIFDFSSRLADIGHIRAYLQSFADKFQSVSNPYDLFQNVSLSMLEDSSNMKLVRSMRLYFLKLLGKFRGLSYVRNALLLPPFCSARWVSQWKTSNDPGFTRFLGANRLPQINPFLTFPSFSEVNQIVTSFLHSGDIIALDFGLARLLESQRSGVICGSLLLACFHEIALLSLLPPENTEHLKAKFLDFEHWILSSSGAISHIPQMFKDMIIYFGLGIFSSRVGKETYLLLNEASSIEHLIKIRLATHIVAAAMAGDSISHPFRYLNTLIFHPQMLVENYFPTMPQDLTKMAQTIMGGRWYACPNNHPFYVDLCGRPTVIQTCAECGAEIGGENHNLLENNKDLGQVGTAYYQTTILADNSEKNYCGRSAEIENQDRFFTTRSLNATSVRVLRLIINSAILSGLCVSGFVGNGIVRSLLNPSFSNPSNLELFYSENVSNDLDLVRSYLTKSMDEVALMLHMIISDVILTPFAGSDPISLPSGLLLPPRTYNSAGDETFATMTHSSVRDYWEEYLDKVHISPYTNNRDRLNNKLLEGQQIFDRPDLDGVIGVFIKELQDLIPIGSLTPLERSISVPGLWQLRRNFSYEEFVFTLKQIPKASEKFPLLFMLISEEPTQLVALRYIPAVLEWFRLLRLNYNGLIDRETARIKTNALAIAEITENSNSPLNFHKFEKIFEGYSKAWNDSWINVLRFGCIKFSLDYNSLEMSHDVPLSFSLPNELDEGNCPLSLIHFLIEKHNAFAQRVDESRLLRSRLRKISGEKNLERVTLISSRFMTNAHTIRCDIHDDLIPLLEKYCMIDSASDLVGYDFAKAENLIIDHFFSDVPAVDLEMPGFRFSHEQYLTGGMNILRQKIKQYPLTSDLVRAIQRDIRTPVDAQHIIELIEQIISFVSVAGGAIVQTLNENVGDMTFGKYIRAILLLNEDIGSNIVAQQVQLKQLEALWNVLSEIASCDPFSGVNRAYKKSLLSSSKSALRMVLANPNFPVEKMLSVLKSFIVENLQEQTISPSASIRVCLIDVEVDGVFLGDAGWFLESFPESIEISEIVEAFLFMKDEQPIIMGNDC